MKKLKQFDRIEIGWVDSCHASGWRKLSQWVNEEKTDGHGLEHLTIGYFISQDAQAISVCQSRNNEGDAFTKNIDAIMTIPMKAVINIKVL